MDSAIEYRDITLEIGSFDDVVAVIERRVAYLRTKGFNEARAEIHPNSKNADGTVKDWTVSLSAIKVDRG